MLHKQDKHPKNTSPTDIPQEHDVRYFAMLHNAVAISDNKQLEGGSPDGALAYYNYLLNLKLPNCPINFDLTEKQINQMNTVRSRLYRVYKINQLIVELFSAGTLYTSAGIDRVLESIKNDCGNDIKNTCYFPSGYLNSENGHFVGLKIRKLENGKYAFSYINHGDGMSNHPITAIAGTKTKYSYQSDEYEINLEDENGRAFLQKILELRHDVKLKIGVVDSIKNAYSATDGYGVLKLYGRKLPTPNPQTVKEKSVTGQRTGSCTVTNTKGMARDTLIDCEADFNDRKRFDFVIKLHSLIDGFNRYLKGEYALHLVAWALNEFSVRLNKQYGKILNDKEMIYCTELANSINEKLTHDKQKLIHEKCAAKPFPSLAEKGDDKRKDPFLKSTKSKVEKAESTDETKVERKRITVTDINPENIKELLKVDKDTLSLSLHEVYSLFNSLPHCSGADTDDFWDRIPQEDLKIIVSNLFKWMGECLSGTHSQSERPQYFAISLIAYDICAQLASRMPNLKLNNAYAFGLDDIYSQKYFYRDPNIYFTVKRIANNFEQRAVGKKRVFTNAINFDQKKYDDTVNYVINQILTPEQKLALTKACQKNPNEQCTDEQLFKHLIDHWDKIVMHKHMANTEGPSIDKTASELIGISATVHSLGDFKKTYDKNRNDLWAFTETAFHNRVERAKDKHPTELEKHLPRCEDNSSNANEHKDYSENTIYHPHKDLVTQRSSYSSGKEPYQPKISGSIHSGSKEWRPDKNQQSAYEQLNEDMRTLECSPNFQIQTTLDWCVNNLDKLKNRDVRLRLEELIFQYGKLENALHNRFEVTMQQLQRVFADLLKYCEEEASKNVELIVWATNLTSDIRLNIEVIGKLHQLPIEEYSLASFNEFLIDRIKSEKDDDLRSEIAAQLIYSYRTRDDFTLEECCLLLTCRVAATLGNSGQISDQIWEKLNSQISKTISTNSETASKMVGELLIAYGLSHVKEWQILDSQLQAIGSDYYINMNTGYLQTPNLKQIKERTERTINDNSELFSSLNLSPNNIRLQYTPPKSSWDRVNQMKSEDGKWEFTYETRDSGKRFHITATYQYMTIDGKQRKFQLLDNRKPDNKADKYFENTNPFESAAYTSTHYQYWQSVDNTDLILACPLDEPQTAFTYLHNNVILVSPYSSSSIEVEKLREISEANTNSPILIDYYGDYRLFALSDGKWNITKLPQNDTLTDQLKKLPFPARKTISKFTQTHIASLRERGLHEKAKHREEEEEKRLQELEIKTTRSINQELLHEIMNAHDDFKNNRIYEYSKDKNHSWQPAAKCILNLLHPETELEQQWAARLGPMFGVDNIRCTAVFDKNTSSWKIDTIKNLALNLTFNVNENNQLVCKEYEHYCLSTERSIEILDGLPSVIILENDQTPKRILIPAFELNEGEGNNALNYDNIIDFSKLCNPSHPYYEFTLNENNELVNDSAEANLYLAILYRSMGEYELAIKHLLRCRQYENIDDKVGAIAMQVMKRRNQSPMDAAFELKLACYIKEHQKKWSNDKKRIPFKEPDEWKKHIENQHQFYQETFSNFKSGIAIIPADCRLSDQELALLGFESKPQTPAQNELSGRFVRAAKLPDAIIQDNHTWETYLQMRHSFNDDPTPELSTFRLDNVNRNPALQYIRNNLNTLFKDAISKDPMTRDKFKKMLFFLVQNDRDQEFQTEDLIAILTCCHQHSEYFNGFEIPKDNRKLLIKIGLVLQEHRDELRVKRTDDELKNDPDRHPYPYRSKVFSLFQSELSPFNNAREAALPSDFTPPSVSFSLSNIKREKQCMYPLKVTSNKYFSKELVPIAKSEFALRLSAMDNPTLLQTKLLNRLKAGHEENKTKTKPSFTANSTNYLVDLKADLKTSRKEDKQLTKQLKNSLIKLANKTPLDNENITEAEIARAHNLLIARQNRQKQPITMDLLFTAFLQKNPKLLTEQNPFLTQEDINQLFADLSDYALLHSRIDQVNEAIKIIGDHKSFPKKEEYKEQQLATILDKPRAYDIKEFPEFLIYEYAMHRLLREDQVIVLKDIIHLIEDENANESDMQHALLQFAAGGGKTSVLIPILAQRFAQKKLLPVIINTNELYGIGLEEIPKNLRASFKQNIEVIERELEHKWDIAELTRLLKDLENWREEGKCLLIKSITWHSINITMKNAHFNQDRELAKAAYDVLTFFKTKSVKLEDECHIVSDPMQQSIQTDDKNPRRIPNNQIYLLMRCYDYLMGREAKHTNIANLAGLNRRSSLSSKELAELKFLLAEQLVDDLIFKGVSRSNLMAYLLPADPNDKTRPQWLKDMLDSNNEKLCESGELIILARAFIQSHMPYALSQQYMKDYGTSIHQGDHTVAPKHEGNDVTSHLGDHTLVVSLTIQLYEQRGLLTEQVDQLLDLILEEHRKERLWNFDFSKPTQAERWLQKVIPTVSSYRDITDAMRVSLRNNESFTKHPHVLKKYLTAFALPQVTVPARRIISTAAEMQAGFQRSILFSATPGLPEVYPAFLKECFLEESFEAQVIETLFEEQNSALCVLKKTHTPTEFFEQFSDPFLDKMTTLIDRGSLITHFDPAAIVNAYLNLDRKKPTYTGTFFKPTQQGSKQQMRLESRDKSVEDTDILGSALVAELKRQGVNPEEFLLFLFLDLSKTTGTDIARPQRDHAGLTVGKRQTITQTIQAAMRERKLNEKDAQSLTWIMFKALYREINPCSLILSAKPPEADNLDTLEIKTNTAYVYAQDKLYFVNKANKECVEIMMSQEQALKFQQELQPAAVAKTLSKVELQTITALTEHQVPETFDPRQLFYWMIRNEAEDLENKIISRAYQGLEQAITGFIWDKINQNPDLFLVHKKVLDEVQEISPSLIYELPSRRELTNIVLTNRLSVLLQKFGLNASDIPPATRQRIEQIIGQTIALVEHLQDPPKTQLGLQVETELKEQDKKDIEEEKQIENRHDKGSDFVFAVEDYRDGVHNLEIIFNQDPAINSRYQKPLLPKCQDIKMPSLYLCKEHFVVTEDKNHTDDTIRQLKPIHYLLLKIMPDKTMQYIACTPAGLEYYGQQIKQNNGTEKDPAYALITTTGTVLQTSANIKLSEVNKLADSKDCQKMMTFTHFLNGEVSNPIILSDVVKELGWEKHDYGRIVDSIKDVHVSRHPVNLLNNEILETKCGWNNNKQDIVFDAYQPRSAGTNINSIPKQQLKAAVKLDNNMQNTFAPKWECEHVLANDLLGKKLVPFRSEGGIASPQPAASLSQRVRTQ